ncbi:MAG: hypothetical protein HYU75_06480 [Betaproteobacteria bacterium]|nr:hypothetical protein [Betaproteobacteria bacterium]
MDGTTSTPLAARYLFVFTRDLEGASARYLLRRAAALERNGKRPNSKPPDFAPLKMGEAACGRSSPG